MENGTGKLDRRIRTIRTTDYKKGGKIKRKRKQLNNQTKHEKREPKSKKLEMHDASLDELELSSKVKKLESKLAPRRWTTRRGPDSIFEFNVLTFHVKDMRQQALCENQSRSEFDWPRLTRRSSS